LYENCPEAYKAKYIDRVFPDIPRSIQLFLGSLAHESLEWLYKEIKGGRSVELDELVKHFANNWHAQFSPDIRINSGEVGDYFNKGVKFLVDYYQRNKPFNENTIEVERKIIFSLDEDYGIMGYVDRIVLNKDGEYEVHDYKTNEMMKTQEELDADRQLALYHLGLREIFGKDINVKLVWHFLAHNRRMESARTPEELGKLRAETLDLIEKIRNTTEWPACGKQWCDWCAWKKSQELDKKVFTRKGNLSSWS